MSDRNVLRNQIASVFAGPLNLEVPAFDTDLFETGVLDSLAFVELLLQLERQFGVTTSVDEMESEYFRSIDSITDYVLRRAGAPAALPSAKPH